MPEGNKHTALFLFGIEHAEALSGLKINTLNQIALAAGLKGSRLGTEIRKAVNLAPYVRLL